MTHTTPPCAGKSRLFDSTDIYDHREAANLCASCPLIEACRSRLELARQDMHGGYGPQGTWAGELVGGAVNVTQIAQEDDEWDDAEARRGHAAYNRGDRSEWARTAHRIYFRRSKRRRRAEVAA